MSIFKRYTPQFEQFYKRNSFRIKTICQNMKYKTLTRKKINNIKQNDKNFDNISEQF